jgi:peroxiredoxin
MTDDIYGDSIKLSDFKGRTVILSFFRDVSCPFCNRRAFEHSRSYKQLLRDGIEVIAVFSFTSQEIREFVAKYPRCFRIIGDPKLEIYNQYGIEHSVAGLFKAVLFNLSGIRKGFSNGGKPRRSSN